MIHLITKRHHDVALRVANRVREQLGKKPVKHLKKGKPGVANHCILANTIGGDVYVNYAPTLPVVYVNHLDNEPICELKLLEEFLSAFDASQIPELIEGGA